LTIKCKISKALAPHITSLIECVGKQMLILTINSCVNLLRTHQDKAQHWWLVTCYYSYC